jgi:subtilisin family serine protease
VVLRDGSDASAAAERHHKTEGATITAVYHAALDGFAATMTSGDAAAVRADPQVESVTSERVFRAPRSTAVQAAPSACPVPLDVTTCQTLTRGVRRIRGDLSSTLSGNGKGRVDANVAVLDSGIDAAHPDLNVVGGTNCFDDGVAIGVDPEGHGTIVAGVIGGRDDSAYVVGIAPGVRLWSVRVLDANLEADDAQVICGLDWVTATRNDKNPRNDIDVVNMSLGGPGSDDGNCGRTNGDPIHRAVCRTIAAGVTIVVAAGNDTVDFAGFIPAAYDDVLTVTAIADGDGSPGGHTPEPCQGFADDAAAPFSNFASVADAPHVVAAPGVCISSDYPNNDVAVDSGTSYAAPFVTGTVVLCLVDGACSDRRPRKVVQKIAADALQNNAKHPAFGFEGDPSRPVAGRYYGPLIDASGY